MTKSLFKRSGNYFLGLIFSKALNLLLFIYVAKLLAPADFGSIIYYSTIIALATLIADFGTVQWYQKQISLFTSKITVIHSLINARFFTFVISALLIGVYLFISQRFSLYVSALLLVTLIPEALLSIFDGYYFEKKQPAKISIKQIARSVILVLFVLIFYQNLTLEIFAFGLFASAIANVFWFVPWKYFMSFAYNTRNALKTLKQSSQYAVLITTSYAYSRGDSIIIENIIGSASLGIYSAAYRYLEGISLLPTALAQNLFHIAAKKDSLKLAQVFKISAVMLVLGLLAGASVFLTASFLTTELLGSEYTLSETVLQVFALVVVLFFVNAPLGSIVQSSDLLKKFIPWGIANTLVNLALNIVYIPLYGVVAAAWIMLITELSGLLINVWFVGRIYKK